MFQQGFVVSMCGVVMWGCQAQALSQGSTRGCPPFTKATRSASSAALAASSSSKVMSATDLHHSRHLGYCDMQDGVRTCCIVKWQNSDHTCAVPKQPDVRLTYLQLSCQLSKRSRHSKEGQKE